MLSPRVAVTVGDEDGVDDNVDIEEGMIPTSK
jgi:hypothetical protein